VGNVGDGDEGNGDGPDHSIGSPQLAAYEHDMKSEIDEADLVLEAAGPVDGEEEDDEVGKPRNTLEGCMESHRSPASFNFIARGCWCR
jgi:hypothetical protein